MSDFESLMPIGPSPSERFWAILDKLSPAHLNEPQMKILAGNLINGEMLNVLLMIEENQRLNTSRIECWPLGREPFVLSDTKVVFANDDIEVMQELEMLEHFTRSLD